MISQLFKKMKELPDVPGVYYFLGKTSPRTSSRPSPSARRGERGEVLYIGKATSLRDRVKSYFSKDIMGTRGPLIVKMVEEARGLKFIETDSVLEALILEVNEIKKHQPYYNSREKDDRSYNYVVVTKEDFPRVLVVRGRKLKVGPWESVLKVRPWKTFGPYPNARELKEALKIIRKIFPYRDEKCKIGKVPKPCFPAQLGLCPGPCASWISKADYRRNIRHLTTFFEGKKDKLIRDLEREMQKLAREQKFEEAEKVKRQIFALQHIQDVALIKADLKYTPTSLPLGKGEAAPKAEGVLRIEAYDIAHISGRDTVGVMTVVDLLAGRQETGELNKSQYRKFKVKGQNSKIKIDDTKNLQEVMRRRLNHPEWRFPNLIVVDGGKMQINAARAVLKEAGLDEIIDIVSVVKDERHKVREILGKPKSVKHSVFDTLLERSILLANAEAHRFAIGYHRLLRSKGFRI